MQDQQVLLEQQIFRTYLVITNPDQTVTKNGLVLNPLPANPVTGPDQTYSLWYDSVGNRLMIGDIPLSDGGVGYVSRAGDTMLGALQLPAGSTTLPSLNFTGSATTGISANSNILSFSTNGSEGMNINAIGVVQIDNLNSAGVVHTDAFGNLSTSTIVNADVSASAAIADSKLATISSSGKVANSATTATNTNTISTIVARDGFGNFAAGTITANLTGSASNNVLKSGDTMTGNLRLASQSGIIWCDNSSNYVEFKAPSVVATSYSLNLPTNPPLVSQQLMTTLTDPTTLIWTTVGTNVPPSTSGKIYVTKYGNDTTGVGSAEYPFLTLSKALSVANALATTTTPISILMAAGIYVENNSSGSLSITANSISIIGDTPYSTIIQPNTLANDLLTINGNSWLINIQFSTNGSSTANGIVISNASVGVIFTNIVISRFNVGISVTSVLTLILNNCLFTINATSMNVNNVTAIINDSIFQGNGTSVGLYATGSSGKLNIISCIFGMHTTGLSLNNNAVIAVSSTLFKNCATGCSINTGGIMNIVGSEFILNNAVGNVINISVNGSGSTCTYFWYNIQ